MTALLALALLTAEPARPNVVLVIADDVSWNDVGVNGSAVEAARTSARTPNIDALAAAGRNFTQAYLTASSCSPSRTSILTGRYPHNNGRAAELHGARPAALPTLAGELRNAGYHTALSGKDHMPVDPPAGDPAAPFDAKTRGKVPGHSGGEAQWVDAVRDAPDDRPFFLWLAAYDAHRGWDADKQWDPKYGPKHDPADLIVPPFLVDDAATRADLASYYNEIARFDWHVGEVVRELESRGDLENTLVLVLADNGRPFPRAKTRLHDSGMRTVLVAHWPAGIGSPGEATDALVSAVDIAPTILSLAGADVPETVQGVSFEAALADPAADVREAAFSEHNWHDYAAHARAVRADGFLYIRNNRPDEAMQGPADSVRSPSHRSLVAASAAHTPAQADTLLSPRPAVEMYATALDPHQLTNLAGDPAYAAVETKLAGLLDRWSEETADSAPVDGSRDSFDRDTGESLGLGQSFRGTPPGGDRAAERMNNPGPR